MHFWSCDGTKHENYMIGQISIILKDRDFWFGQKNVVELCTVHFATLGVIR